MLACWIVWRALEWNKRPLSSDATLKLCLHLLCAALFQWVSAAAHNYPCDQEQG